MQFVGVSLTPGNLYQPNRITDAKHQLKMSRQLTADDFLTTSTSISLGLPERAVKGDRCDRTTDPTTGARNTTVSVKLPGGNTSSSSVSVDMPDMFRLRCRMDVFKTGGTTSASWNSSFGSACTLADRINGGQVPASRSISSRICS